MLTFFRRIRQRLFGQAWSDTVRKGLLGEGGASRYFLYAMGEIALVVIGILIALQINNWNEWRKEKAIEKTYLLRIQDDLEIDHANLERVISILKRRVNEYSLLDPGFTLPPEARDTAVEANYGISYLVATGYQFRPTIGAYRALISDGRTNLFSNRELFAKIQDIYEIRFDLAKEYATRADEKSDQLLWERRHEIRKNLSLTSPNIDSQAILDDLNYLHNHQLFYSGLLVRAKHQVEEVIQMIEQELGLQD